MNKKETHKIMKFRQWIRESVKNLELNNILDKISSKGKVSEKEKNFLDNYANIKDDDMMDYTYLSPESIFFKILEIMDRGKKITCNLYDRDGLIGLQIVGIRKRSEENIYLKLKNTKEDFKLKDNFLYNIMYNSKKDEYSLESQEEFYEKIPVKGGR